MEKRFNHNDEEEKIYKAWEEAGYFSPEECIKKGVTDKEAEPFSMVLPPPNVTGIFIWGTLPCLLSKIL